jgi:hypothetical protein
MLGVEQKAPRSADFRWPAADCIGSLLGVALYLFSKPLEPILCFGGPVHHVPYAPWPLFTQFVLIANQYNFTQHVCITDAPVGFGGLR